MNRLLLIALVACIGLSACSKKEEVAAAIAPPSASATTPNSGKVLQIQQAAGYTYAEVDSRGQRIWIAGGPIEVKPGDTVQWGEYAVMQNFHSKTLGRDFEQILFVNAWGPAGGVTAQVAPHGAAASQGLVKSVAAAAGYTYVEVDQGGKLVWVAAPVTLVKVGDTVRWEGASVMHNFTAKSLGRTFERIIFASQVAVVQ